MHAGPKHTLVSLEEARTGRASLPFTPATVAKPKKTGVTVLDDVSVATLRPYIDWTPFFHTWELKGVYPRIFENAAYGDQAKKLFDEANELLDALEKSKLLTSKAVYGIFPANAVGDDVELYTDETRAKVLTTFRFLRQQTAREPGKPHTALSDFVAPKGMANDYLGAFAVTSALGLSAEVKRLKAALGDYAALLLEVNYLT